MSPTPQMYSWTQPSSQSPSQSPSNQGWSQSNSSNQGWNSQSFQHSSSASSGFSTSFSSEASFMANSNTTNNNNNNSSSSGLPKFQETFDVGSSWSNSGIRRGSEDGEGIFGNPKRKVDWDGEVEKVFLQEIGRASQEIQSRQPI